MRARVQERAISERFIFSRWFAGARARPSRPFDRPFLPDAASSSRSRFYSASEGREKGDVRRRGRRRGGGKRERIAITLE